MRLGFIGLGKMGKPMAANLLKAGHQLVVCNRSQQVVDELVAQGATAAQSPAELAGQVDFVHLCLPVGKDVESVVTGPGGVLEGTREGTVVVDHSTIDPEDSRRLHETCRAQGVAFLDAPVSGGVTGAEAGTLAIMVGGDRDSYERAYPFLERLGNKIAYVGASGSGNVMKLINQMLVGISQCAVAEAMVLATKAGLDPAQAYDILANSYGDSAILRRSVPNFVLKRNFSPAFTLDLLNKDLGLATQLAKKNHVRALMTGLAQQLCLEGSFAGYGGQDMSAVVRVLENLAGIEVRGEESR